MTLLECLRQEALRLGRCGLSSKELSRVEVMGRVKAGSLQLQEAAELLGAVGKELQRDKTPELAVFSFIDNTHSTRRPIFQRCDSGI